MDINNLGQGSTFGLKSLDLTRAVILRDFRDFVLKRLDIPLQPARSLREREKIVLVGLRVAGSAGGMFIMFISIAVHRHTCTRSYIVVI